MYSMLLLVPSAAGEMTAESDDRHCGEGFCGTGSTYLLSQFYSF